MNVRYIIGIAVIVVFIAWGAMSFFETTIQYVPIEKALRSHRTVQVLGKIDFATAHYNEDSARLEVEVYDPDAADPQSADRMKVHYYGIVPGNFEQATSVVLKGKGGGNGCFVAEQMLVKCPSKYQGEGAEYQDVTKHRGG